MFYSTLTIAVTALTGLASALNFSTSGPLTITVSQVPAALRQTWCNAQMVACPEVCGGQAFPNNCDPNTLTYQCVCTDGSHPNISDYQQTVPFFICEQWKTNCIDNSNQVLSVQDQCLAVTCGMKNASNVPLSGSSASSSSAASSSPSATGGSGGSGGSSGGSSSSTSSGFAAATHIAQQYGTQILAGGMLAVFGMAL